MYIPQAERFYLLARLPGKTNLTMWAFNRWLESLDAYWGA